ncbi:peptidase domain containing associated with muscle reproteinration 1 [Chamberlinius hualienensis]
MQRLPLMLILFFMLSSYLHVTLATANCSAIENQCLSCGYVKPVCQCINGGLCNETSGSCECPITFTGKFCENRVACDPPESVPNLKWNITSMRIGDIITASCKYGYDLLGHNKRHCLSNGTWAPAAPVCKAKCGLAHSSADLLEAKWKWHSAIFIFEEGQWIFRCSGSLISDKWLVTAAYCVSDSLVRKELDVSQFKLYIGLTSKAINSFDEANSAEYKIKRFVIHPNFHTISYDSNIALIELKSSVNYSENLFPICLPPAFDNINVVDALNSDLNPNIPGIVSGWAGREILHNNTFLIIKRKECHEKYRDLKIFLTTNMFCGKIDICSSFNYDDENVICAADFGSPFVLQEVKSKYVLHGILGGGVISCGCGLYPMIFVHVAHFVPWIEAYVSNPSIV